MKYPWQKMKVGESFRVEGSSPRLHQTLRNSGYQWLARHSETHGHLRVIVRKEGNEACRVWMINKNWMPSYPLYEKSHELSQEE